MPDENEPDPTLFAVDSTPISLDEDTYRTKVNKKEISYGWWNFRPKFLQVFANPIWALLFLCLGCLCQGIIINGLLHNFIYMLEKRYDLSSKASGFMSGSYDIASLLCLIPITYIGGHKKSSKPVFIGVGIIILGTGSFVFASPQFLTKAYYSNVKSNLCSQEEKPLPTQYESDHTTNTIMYCLLVAGNFLHGIGGSPIYTLSVTYVDDSVPRGKSSIYLGVYYLMAVIGPSFGYLLGARFGQIHVDFNRAEHQEDLSPSSTSWVGAWWLGFIIFGSISFICAIPILGLPKSISGADERANINAPIRSSSKTMPEFPRLTELPQMLMNIITNLQFLLISLAGCCEGMVLAGMGAFLPKILNRQFSLTTSQVALIMGSVCIPACLVGMLVGGALIKVFRLEIQGILRLCMGLTFCAMFLQLGILIYCKENVPEDLLDMLNTHADSDTTQWALVKKCNADCNCEKLSYFPICDYNGNSYFSPCMAGCHKEKTHDSTKEYFDCNCIEGASAEGWQAKLCQNSCKAIIPFLILVFLYQIVTFSAAIPALTATLRSVERDFKSLALGVQWILVRLLGTIVGPVCYGALIDMACIYSSQSSTGRGACLVYDQFRMSWYLTAFGGGFKLLQFCFFAAAYKLSVNWIRHKPSSEPVLARESKLTD